MRQWFCDRWPRGAYLPVSRADLPRIVLLAVGAALVWIAWQGAWRRSLWESPASYSVDALEYLARLKLAAERGPAFLVDESAPRLGAPWVADWGSYPMPDRLINLLTGEVSRFTGLIAAGNLSLLAAHVLAVVAFFIGARLLGHRPVFAAAGGLVFGFCYSIAQRGFSHYSLALAYVVPLMLALALVAGGARHLLARRGWQVGGAVIAAAVALGSPYFGFIFGQLLLFALLARMGFHRGRGSGVVAAWMVVYALVFVGSNFAAVRTALAGEGAVMARDYADAETYGLRPIEFFIPPATHRLPAAAELGRHYAAVMRMRGELFFPYLGLIGIAGLLVLTGSGVRRLAKGRFGLRPAYLPLVAWIVVLAVVGGVAAAFALGVTGVFRAANRYSICVLALALLALTSMASRRTIRWPRLLVVLASGACVAIAWWDQLPPRSPDRAAMRAQVQDDRRFAARLEAALPPGAMVFQMPAVAFLEQPPVGAMTDYELFRPFLHTRTLRFSYGALSQSTEYAWQRNVARLPPAALVAALERAGFAALHIRRDAFADRAAAIEAALVRIGRERLLDAGHQVVFRLQPAANAAPPGPLDPLRFNRWDDSAPTEGESVVLLGEGWFGPEHGTGVLWRWAGRRATLRLWNASPQPCQAKITFAVTATATTVFRAGVGAVSLQREVTAYQPLQVEFSTGLAPGMNELVLATDAPARRAAPNDRRQIGFSVSALEVRFMPQTGTE